MVVLEDDLGPGVGDPAGPVGFDRVVVDVVELNDTEVGMLQIESRDVGPKMTAPADVHRAGSVLEPPVGRPIALVADPVVVRVVGAGGELPDVVGDLDHEAVVPNW